MRKVIYFISVLGVCASAGTNVLLHATYGPATELHFDNDRSVDKKMDLMKKKLSLTPTQIYRVQQALQDQATKNDLLKKEYLEARKKIADDTNGEFLSILNPTQQESYEKIKTDVLGKQEINPDGTIPPSAQYPR